MSEINFSGKQLAELFAADLAQQEFDVRSVGELVHFAYKGEDYYAFLRAISYAGNPHPKNRFRAQMPKRPYLEPYKDNGGIFLFVGYDQAKDVYVIWNPYVVRPRINQKDTVSLFCDEDALSKAQEDGICWSKLPNGGLYVVFNIKQLSTVLDNLIYFQDETPTESHAETSVDVTSFINSMIKDNRTTLEIIEACMDKFAAELSEWDYLTWRRTIIQCRNAYEEHEKEKEPTVEEVHVKEIYDAAIHDIRYYRHCLKEIGKREAPDLAAKKYVMVLSLCEYLPKCPSTNKVNNVVPLLATWEGIFINDAQKYLSRVGRESTLFSTPFILMGEEPFWHLIPYDSEGEDLNRAMRTFEKLQDIYKGVEIDHELAKLIHNPQSCDELKTIILGLIPQKKEKTTPDKKHIIVPSVEPNITPIQETTTDSAAEEHEKSSRVRWNADEMILALDLYFRLPFGKFHKGTPEIIDLANLTGRTPSSIAMRLSNYEIFNSGKGLDGGKEQCKPYWDKYVNNRQQLEKDAKEIRMRLTGKHVSQDQNHSSIQATHERFWNEFIEYNKQINGLYADSKGTVHDWLGKTTLKLSGVAINIIIQLKACRSEIYINTGSKEENKRIFDFFYAHRQEIEKEIPNLEWQRLDNKITSRIYVGKPLSFVRLEDKEEIFRFFTENTDTFMRVFAKYADAYKNGAKTPVVETPSEEPESPWKRFTNIFRKK